MPELPEVETIATDLNRQLVGKSITAIELIDKSKVLKTPLSEFKKRLSGARIKRIYRRAKMLVIESSSGLIVFHLKMTGQLIYISKKLVIAGGHPIASTGVSVPNKFTRLVFSLNNGGKLYFNDPRKFGWIKFMTPEEFRSVDEGVGIEPLSDTFTLEFFKNMLSRRSKAPIKAVLLDQKKLSGLGNIYVDETLFLARVRPDRRIASLTTPEIKAIFQAIPKILSHAVRERGTTFRNFTDPDGLKGNFVSFLKVYGRKGKPCARCGRSLTKSRVAGRGTHYCAHCQK